MTLKQLVEKAYAECPRFKAKYDWQVVTRNRIPKLWWLMPLLEEALGRDFVSEAAELHLEASNEASIHDLREQTGVSNS